MSIDPNLLLLTAGITLAAVTAHQTLFSIRGIALHTARRNELVNLASKLNDLWSKPAETELRLTPASVNSTPITFTRKTAGVAISQGAQTEILEEMAFVVLLRQLRKVARIK